MLKEAILKLEDEMQGNEANEYVQYVGKYMVNYLKEHPVHAERILAEGKTLSGSLKFMEGEARKKKNTGLVMLTPEEGFKAVLKYYEIQEESEELLVQDVEVVQKKTRKVNISLEDLL